MGLRSDKLTWDFVYEMYLDEFSISLDGINIVEGRLWKWHFSENTDIFEMLLLIGLLRQRFYDILDVSYSYNLKSFLVFINNAINYRLIL